jgi:hypothetical protein
MKSNITNLKIVHGKLCHFYIDSWGVMNIVVNDNLITMDDLLHDYKMISFFLKGKKVPLFFDASSISPIEKKIRKKLEEILEENFISLAVISTSRVGMAVANIFFGLSSSKFPKKIFNSRSDAYKWLNAQFLVY